MRCIRRTMMMMMKYNGYIASLQHCYKNVPISGVRPAIGLKLFVYLPLRPSVSSSQVVTDHSYRERTMAQLGMIYA